MKIGRLAALALCLLLPAVALAAKDRAAEKARKKAYKEARTAFLRGVRSEDSSERREAVLGLREFADLGGARLVVEKVFGVERSPRVLDAGITVVSAAKDPEVVGWLADKATGSDSWRRRAPLVEALGGIDADTLVMKTVGDALSRMLAKEKDPRVLSMALFDVGQRGMKGALDLVLGRIDHEEWQVRVAVFEALAELKQRKAVPFLIDRLFRERGRLRQDIADALKAITGRSFGTDEEKWRKWFSETGGQAAPEPEPKPKKDPHYADDGPTYFGMKVVSERVLFIIDVSLSMKTPIDIDKMKVAREAALTGKDRRDENKDRERFEDTIKWWKIKDRLDLAKAQLEFVIKNLRKNQKFEIVSFSDTVKAWNEGNLVRADPRWKARAVQFVDSLGVEGGTAAGAVLDFAFEMAGPGAYDKNYHSGVDTIYFLSDGAPSDRDPEQILEDVRRRNRLRKIKIHVIAIFNQSIAFLRKLAEQNGGTYKFFKVEDK